MPSPALTFGLLLGTLCGALVHLILDGNGRRLLLYILASWVGLAIGQAVGDVMGIQILSIGPTNVLTGVLGAFISMGATIFLAWRRGPRGPRQ